jgi:hypothetical protein
MFGDMPAYGFFIRHVKGIELNNIQLSTLKPDERPPIVLEDAKDVTLYRVKAARGEGVPMIKTKSVQDLVTNDCLGVPDGRRERSDDEKL